MKRLLAALISLLACGGAYAACPAGSTCATFAAFTSATSAATTLAGTELFPCIQSAATVNCTPAQLLTYLSTASFPIGGTTAAAGKFTTLSASSTVSGTGFSTYLASPPAIGGTVAAAGSFTTLVGTTLNGNTFTTGTYTLTGVAGKTLTFNKSITLDGTDSTTMTFPGTSQTIAGLGTAQTWTAVQTYTNSDIKLLGSSTGATTFTSANAGASNFTLTFPAATDTVAALAATQTLTNTSMNGVLIAGTKFTVAATGCTPSATTGGATAGTITLAAGPCTSLVITMNGATGKTAATGWHCDVGDRTAQNGGTFIPAWYENSSTTTTATVPVPAAAGATDVLTFACTGF